MEGRSKPQNLDNFAAVSRGILWTGTWNLAKFTTENWALLILFPQPRPDRHLHCKSS